MGRFIFSLQNILNIKEKLEEQAKNEYSQAKREQLEERLEEEKRHLQEDISDSLNVREIRERENAVEIFRMYVRQQILVVMQRDKEVEVAREHLNEAMKERKTFEKLREHAFEKFRLEENLREQKEVDELVSYRYGTDSD